jgi:leader peptidase (prepilin peptidase) / N-methyltransferase
MFSFFVFLFGIFIGSFLNVVIYRVPRGESIVFPSSHCPHCRHRLAWYDLIPLVSYLLLRGKCKYCKQNISLSYPLVELSTGLLFLFLFYLSITPIVNIILLLYLLTMGSIFTVIFFTDLKYGIIPFQVIFVGLIVSFLYLFSSFSFSIFLNHIFSSLGAFISFLSLFLLTKGRGMGLGDVVLVLLMGLFLGFPNIAFALYLAFLTGAIISLILVLIGSKRLRHDTIPFGPFLVAGTLISLFLGNSILRLMQYFLPL